MSSFLPDFFHSANYFDIHPCLAGSGGGKCMFNYLETSNYFPKWLHHFPISSMWEFKFFHILAHTWLLNFNLKFSHSSRFLLVLETLKLKIVFLICIPIIIDDAEYIFKYFFANHVSLVKCMFKSFAHLYVVSFLFLMII